MERIILSNFRKIKDSWNLNLAPITFFTGTNNSGKSTIIKSLLLLEDYVKSNNHFELNFHGNNFYKHKIESFKNAINRTNFKNFNKDISFEYQNNGYEISLVFQTGQHYQTGILRKLKMVREDKATIEMSLTNSNTYQLKIDSLLMNKSKKSDNLKELTQEEILINNKNEIQKLIDDGQSRIKYLESEEIEISSAIKEYQSKDVSSLPEFYQNEYKNKTEQLKKIVSESNKGIISLTQMILEYNKKINQINKSLKNKGGNEKILFYSPTFVLDDFSISDRRIDKILRTVLPKYLVDHNLGNKRKKNSFKNSDESLELDKANKLGDELLLALSFNVKHLSPHRSNQNKLFLHENKDVDINYLVKNHFEKQLHSDLTVLQFMKKWMSKDYFDIGDDYKITTYESTVSKIEVYEDETWINLSDKGFGAGQVFSILLAIASSILETQGKFAKKGALFQEDLSVILIEEPEANLHPGLQSKLAELFLDANKEFGINFILETHSEYIIRKSQLLNLENPNFFKLYYFDDDKPYEMEYLNNGKFNRDFGEGFTDVADNIEVEIYKKNIKRK
jgi:predicted ATPase